MLRLMVLLVILLGVSRWYTAPERHQRQAQVAVERAGGSVVIAQEPADWLRQLFGVETVEHLTRVDLGSCELTEPLFDSITRLPHLETLVLGGENVTDDHLNRRHGPCCAKPSPICPGCSAVAMPTSPR